MYLYNCVKKILTLVANRQCLCLIKQAFSNKVVAYSLAYSYLYNCAMNRRSTPVGAEVKILFKGCKQHSSGKLKLPSSQPTLISRRRCEKYSSKLDISRSFVCIFMINQEDTLHSL